MTAGLQNKISDSPQLPSNVALPCTMNSESQCFDWSRCPISSGYPIYFYENDSMDDENGWANSVGRKSGYFTSDPNEACLFVVSGRRKIGLKARGQEARGVKNRVSPTVVPPPLRLGRGRRQSGPGGGAI